MSIQEGHTGQPSPHEILDQTRLAYQSALDGYILDYVSGDVHPETSSALQWAQQAVLDGITNAIILLPGQQFETGKYKDSSHWDKSVLLEMWDATVRNQIILPGADTINAKFKPGFTAPNATNPADRFVENWSVKHSGSRRAKVLEFQDTLTAQNPNISFEEMIREMTQQFGPNAFRQVTDEVTAQAIGASIHGIR